MPKTEDKNLPIMSVVEVKKARTSHEGIPQYQVTPLAGLKGMAEYLDLARAYVKDESYRFGLNAFKVLGGSCAIARYTARKTRRGINRMPYSALTSKELRNEFGQAIFFSTTDGNHGRDVAQATNRLGQKCVIRMPVGSTENRRRHIEDEGAECTIEKVNYGGCVRMVVEEAKRAECDMVIQGTTWEGYEEILSRIMQGYSTIADETVERFERRPTHVFAQAGVGSLTGGVMGYFANKYKKNPPAMVVMEAGPAACLYRGAEATDGEIRIMDGEMSAIMVDLCCSESNTTPWDISKDHMTAFLAVDDDMAGRNMCMLAAPFKEDPQVVSGESGAATFGALAIIMKDESYHELRLEPGLGQDSKVLMFSTEGDADPDRYKTIIQEGGLK